MTNRIYTQLLRNNFLIFFSIFLLIGIYLNLNSYVELATNDDRTLWDLLINGERGTLILSYPLSSLFVLLYQNFPDIPWYSGLLSSIMLLHSYLFASYIHIQKKPLSKFFLGILFSLIIIIYWVNLSITLLTVSLLATALLFVQSRFLIFITLLILATFLRTSLVLTFSPIVLLSIILLYKFPLKKFHILALIFFTMVLLLNLLSPKLDKDYSQWLAFNKAKSYYIDLHKPAKKNILTPEQTKLLQLGWWIQDEQLLPSETLIDSSGSKLIILKDSIARFNFNFFIEHRYKYLFLLFLLATIIITIERKKYSIIYLFLFSAISFVVFTKDVERTTIPLLFTYLIILLSSFQRLKKPRYFMYYIFLILNIIILIKILPMEFSNRHKYYKEIVPLKKEFLKLLNASNKQCEMSINFPTPFYPASSVLMGNKLFDEKHWISFKYTSLLPTGWLSRHPFFYKSHNISSLYTKRKFKNYYDFLMNNDTGFIASKDLLKDRNYYNILHNYDLLYNKDRPLCKHTAIIIKESKQFAISKIINKCQTITEIP